MNVFDKLDDARNHRQGVSLTVAELELLFELVGNEIVKAGAEWEMWRERFEDHAQRVAQEAGG